MDKKRVELTQVPINPRIQQELLDVVRRHKLPVGPAMGHLLQLAASLGKTHEAAVGSSVEAKALFQSNAGAAYDAASSLQNTGPAA